MPSSELHEETEETEAQAKETETRPPEAEATAETTSAKADEPAWPPVEARPEEPAASEPAAEVATPAAEAAQAEAAQAEAILTKPEAAPAVELPPAPQADGPKAEPELGPAAEPKQEMGLSESTLHWLVDGEQPVEALPNDPGTAPHYDSGAPVPGRKRTVIVIGGAAVLAFAVAVLLHAQASGHRTDSAADANEPGEVMTQRAEAALAAGRSGEAMDLARLAIAANPRLADAYVVVGKVERDSGRLGEARDAYRKYLDLAPIGTHAAEARAALAALPP